MLEHNLNEHCGDASCTICAWNDLAPVKPSPKPIAISRWDHPDEGLKQYLARERPPVTCTLAQAYGVQSCQHPDCQICFPPGPVTHGWEGLDDEPLSLKAVLAARTSGKRQVCDKNYEWVDV